MYTLSSYSVLKYAAVTCLVLGNKKFLCHVFKQKCKLASAGSLRKG